MQPVSEVQVEDRHTSVWVFHNEIVIDKPVEQVWPHLFKYLQWNPHHVGAKTVRVAGEPECEGDVLIEYPKVGDGYGPPFVLEIVKIIPFKKIVWKLYEPREERRRFVVNFTDFSLERRGESTRFIYNSYFEFMRSARDTMPSEEAYEDAHRDIFECLKRFAEAQ